MNRYFEGGYRRTPQQNLAGASRNHAVSELIHTARAERKKREEARLILDKTLVLQAAYRGHVCRKYWKKIFLKEYCSKIDEVRKEKNVVTVSDLCYLIQRMEYLYPKGHKWTYKTQQDLEELQNFLYVMRLMQISKANVIEAMGADRYWIWRVIHCLILHTHFIRFLPSGLENIVPMILQMFSSFLDVDLYFRVLSDPLPILELVWEEIMDHGAIMQCLIKVLQIKKKYRYEGTYNRVIAEENIILNNFIRIINTSKRSSFKEEALDKLGEYFIKQPLSKIASNHIISTFKSMDDFPLEDLVHVYLKKENDAITPESLYRFLFLDKNQSAIPVERQRKYFQLLSKLLFHLHNIHQYEEPGDDCDSDVDFVSTSNALTSEQQSNVKESLNMLNSTFRSEVWSRFLNIIVEDNDLEHVTIFCKCLYLLWLPEQLPIYYYRIIKSVAFHPGFLKLLWQCVLSEKRSVGTINHQVYWTWNMIARGVILTAPEADAFVPSLTMFCYFLKLNLAILNDDLFYKDEPHNGPECVPFTISELRDITSKLKEIAVGLISLAYPTFSFDGEERIEAGTPSGNVQFNTLAWQSLLEQVIGLLRLLHIRNSRHPFTSEGFWLSNGVPDAPKPNQIKNIDKLVPFVSSGVHPSFNAYECRYVALLQSLPFVSDFIKRLMLLQTFITDSKGEYQNPGLHFLQTAYILVQIRRDYIYEDAFDKLNADEVPECRIQIRIHLVSSLGVEEPGVDGGGLFREFIIEFLKTAFDPNRGFFLMNEDNEFYPNPEIAYIQRDYARHYAFIGRMLGKALYENVLVEIPLAEFFLANLLGNTFDLYLNGLASLDPDMYRNLMFLMTYNGDFVELGLDFTLSLDYFGTNKVMELKPNGSNIPVTKDNVLEYIHLVAKFKISSQISRQTEAFLHGLTSVIPQNWLSMFSTKELQLIISGNESPIDIRDLQACAVYADGYTAEHPTVKMFWKVAASFDNTQKSQLLKFVTSCSRPPLLGFKELYPPFCIQFVDSETMLPSASTCMNIFKLPNFQDEETMRQKVLYAISSESGFELI